MSKIYDKYIELKEIDNEKMYLFRCGNFYIFLDEDASKINEYVVLKMTQFTKNVLKCGFPITSLESYLKVFQNHQLKIEVVEDNSPKSLEEKMKKIIKILENTKIEKITPIESINILQKVKEICDGK